MDYNDFLEELEEYIRNSDLSIGQAEILGATLNSLGYLIIAYGAKIDIYELLNDETNSDSAFRTFLLGQSIIALGYSILWVVSLNRLKTKRLENDYLERQNSLNAYRKVEISYLLSAFANFLRLEAFYELLVLKDEELKEEENEEE
ncbi:hypothetical protein E5347_11155 [Clostridium sartagoforme]|uniref:Uncharacterized protein n=1 Tax=Clostridium sartagoforme TaxID=84031 RepID=A0A4S2DI95_9CLOT|nr:hypothetical protein [Clostridium sartagoforme]TGY41866.1 hypothetical protein E5347_11155 [Clostridium sartagoforme]